jgi:voltage-dependent anion channel protein 2
LCLIFLGLSLTQTWTTSNSLDTKLELEDNLTKGLKAEILTNYLPAKKTYGGKLNLHYKQPNIHTRLFTDLFKGPTATFDMTLGHEGFLIGAEGGYDVGKAAITKYAVAAGYSSPSYAAALTATSNLSIFSASYYHKVNTEVEAGAKATWDSNAGSNVGLELATKYKLDPSSFAKVRTLNQLIWNTLTRHRPRSTTEVLLLSPTTSSWEPVLPLVLAHPLIPRI